MDKKDLNTHFVSMVMMLDSACWQQLGKVVNPISGEIEKELSHASISIDMLLMFREKTKGNLTPDEAKLLDKTIAVLQLNYAEEIAKETKPPTA